MHSPYGPVRLADYNSVRFLCYVYVKIIAQPSCFCSDDFSDFAHIVRVHVMMALGASSASGFARNTIG